MTEIQCEQCKQDFSTREALDMHNKAKHPENIKKPAMTSQQKKKIRNWVIAIFAVALIGWGVFAVLDNDTPTGQAVNIPKNPIHWHPDLTIIIDGEEELIRSGIGMEGGHKPTHTHETDGTIHLENNRPTAKTMTVGYFFQVWKKR